MKKYLAVAAVILAMFAAACSKAPSAEPKEAVRKALLQYLAARQNLSLDKMDVEVSKVNFTGDAADAEVSFKVKGTTQGMSMKYTLHRTGDTWTVDKASSTAPNHPSPGTGGGPGAGTGAGLATPTTPIAPEGGVKGELPSGHPPVAQETPSTPKKK